MKSDFQSSQGLIQKNWGLCRSVTVLVVSKGEQIFDHADLRNKST